MITSYQINANSLNSEFVDSIKSAYPNKIIDITISDQLNNTEKKYIEFSKYEEILDKNELLEELLLAENQIKNGEYLSNDDAKRYIFSGL